MKGPRACSTCIKAKSRCAPAPAGKKCERCERLFKPCSFSTSPAPAPAPEPPRLPRSRVAELQSRLDEISTSPSPAAAVYPFQSHTIRRHNWNHLFPRDSSSSSDQSDPAAAHDATSWPGSGSDPSSSTSLYPLEAEAERMLNRYRDQYSSSFPFVAIPGDVSERRLGEESPFVWRAVMIVGCYSDGPRQLALGDDFMGRICCEAVSRGRKSLDLLQGLQLFVAWYRFSLSSVQLSHLLFLARSMCVGLIAPRDLHAQSDRLDEMRALAGAYYVNTLAFTTSKCRDVFLYSPELEACCGILEARRELPTDEHLVSLVRVQQLSQSICQALHTSVPGAPMRAPILLLVQSFQQQLETFRSLLPETLQQDRALSSHITIAQVLLYETALQEPDGAPQMTLTDRLELLWRCLTAAKSYWELRFAAPGAQQTRFVCLSTADFLFVFVTSLRLMTVRVPGFDLRTVRAELDFVSVVERQVGELERMAERRRRGRGGGGGGGEGNGGERNSGERNGGERRVDDPLQRLALVLRRLRDELLANGLDRVMASAPSEDADAVGDGDSLMRDMDDSFWQELLRDCA